MRSLPCGRVLSVIVKEAQAVAKDQLPAELDPELSSRLEASPCTAGM